MKKQWRPNEGDTFFSFTGKNLRQSTWYGSDVQEWLLSKGLIFRSLQEAEEAMRKHYKIS